MTINTILSMPLDMWIILIAMCALIIPGWLLFRLGDRIARSGKRGSSFTRTLLYLAGFPFVAVGTISTAATIFVVGASLLSILTGSGPLA